MVLLVTERQLASDTSEACWLCDRERGDLCHVHEPVSKTEESEPPELSWALPMETE